MNSLVVFFPNLSVSVLTDMCHNLSTTYPNFTNFGLSVLFFNIPKLIRLFNNRFLKKRLSVNILIKNKMNSSSNNNTPKTENIVVKKPAHQCALSPGFTSLSDQDRIDIRKQILGESADIEIDYKFEFEDENNSNN